MDTKLKLFLDKINLKEEYFKYFNAAKLEKIKCSSDKLNWNFIIDTNDLLPLDVIKYMDEHIKEGFSELNTVTYTIIPKESYNVAINNYYPYVISTLGLSSMMESLFKDKLIKFTTDGLVIEVDNKAMEQVLNSNMKKIKTKLKSMGFDVDLKIIINESEIKKEILEDKNIDVSKIAKPEVKEKKREAMKMASTKQIDENAILGREISSDNISGLENLDSDLEDVTIEAKIFDKELFESTKTVFKIITLKVTDNNDSFLVKVFFRNQEDFERIDSKLKIGNWYRINGNIKYDDFARDFVLNANNIMDIETKDVDIKDEEKDKRIELHAHTMMSQMDGCVTVEDLIKTAKKWGHRGIAITDHDGVQSFPNAFNMVRDMNKDLPEGEEPFKVIYGAELTMIDDNVDIVVRPSEDKLEGTTYVVFDLDKFDTSFIKMAYQKYNLGEFTNPVIDTLELSRALDKGEARHSLSAITKRYNVDFDEEGHHRGDYDAKGTALALHKMLQKCINNNMKKISDLNNLVSKNEIHKYGKAHHINILTLNKKGLKNLFILVSLANTKYLYKTPRILRSEIEKYREGLLIGSGCYEGEVFTEASTKSDEELTNIINFYDYVEVQPLDCYCHLVPGVFASDAELLENVEKIIRVTKAAGKIICATGDVHHLKKEDKIYREIIINQKVPGRGRHPLTRGNGKIPSEHFRTTREMLDAFSFLSEEEARELVIDNPNMILDKVEVFDVIVQTGGVPFSPRVKSDDGKEYLDCPKEVTSIVYSKVEDWYGNPLPHNIEERLGTELYGDIVLKSVRYFLDKENKNNDEEAFKELHRVITSGKDNVFDLVRRYIKETSEEELNDEA